MKKLLTLSLAVVMICLCFGFGNITADAATLSAGQTQNLSWYSGETYLKVSVPTTGFYQFSMEDNYQTGVIGMGIWDGTLGNEIFWGILANEDYDGDYVVSASATSSVVYLVAGHDYTLTLEYWDNESGDSISANIDLSLNKVSLTPATIPNCALSSSSTNISFTASSHEHWLQFTTGTAGDYTLNFNHISAYINVIDSSTGDKVYDTVDTEYMSDGDWATRTKLVLNLDARTTYYIFFKGYSTGSSALSMTANSKTIQKIEINSAIYNFNSLWAEWEIGGDCFNWKVTYTDRSTQNVSASFFGASGYDLPLVAYEGEYRHANGSTYLAPGWQNIRIQFLRLRSTDSIFIKSISTLLLEDGYRINWEKDKMLIQFEDYDQQSYFWRVKVSEDGYYAVYRNNSDAFNTNFAEYSIRIMDFNLNEVEINSDNNCFLLRAGQEYVLNFKYTYADGCSWNDIEFWLQKESGLAPDPAGRNGWIDFQGKWYYAENGSLVKNRWMRDSVGWVYIGENGYMLTNSWCMDSVGWCYVGADGYAVTNCWKQDSVGWCYLNANGSMTKNAWVLDGGKWYWLDGNGYMVANQWRLDSVGWCYLGADGAMVTEGWVPDSVDIVYVGSDGYMVRNRWCMLGSDWCYVGHDGYRLRNQWMNDSRGWCFLAADGIMVTNDWVRDSVGWCYLDGSGYWDGIYYPNPSIL